MSRDVLGGLQENSFGESPMHTKRRLLFLVCLVFGFCAAMAIASAAQTLTTLATFIGPNGENPQASLIQGADGNLYGTTQWGGGSGLDDCGGTYLEGCGTIFKITPSGTLTTLHSFNNSDGSELVRGLVQGTDGNFYGTTLSGGAHDWGTVFKITPGGVLTTLHNFSDGADGASPWAGLVQGTDGNFYGTTWGDGGPNYGSVFKITPAGTLTTLYHLGGPGGSQPMAGLVLGTDGNFYGTTYTGGERRRHGLQDYPGRRADPAPRL